MLPRLRLFDSWAWFELYRQYSKGVRRRRLPPLREWTEACFAPRLGDTLAVRARLRLDRHDWRWRYDIGQLIELRHGGDVARFVEWCEDEVEATHRITNLGRRRLGEVLRRRTSARSFRIRHRRRARRR